jgi:hypothetical protein
MAGADLKVYKNSGIEFLDEFYRNPKNLSVGRDALRGGNAEITKFIGARAPKELRDGTLESYREEWAGGKRAGDDFEAVMTQGYLEAIKAAEKKGVPIETFFVTGALAADQFEVHLCETEERVFVFLFLPAQANHAGGSKHARAKSSVIRTATGHPDEEAVEGPVVKVVTSPGA